MADSCPDICGPCEKGKTKKGCKDVCYDAELYRKTLDTTCDQKLTATDVFYRYKDAVVVISGYARPGPNSEIPITGTLFPAITVQGFIIRVGSKLYVIGPSIAVVMSPSNVVPIDIPIGTVFDSWFATVKNANLEGCNVIYQLTLLGYTGQGDTAVFGLDYDIPFNKCLRKLKHHPYLQWSNSRETPVGSPAFIFSYTGSIPSVAVPHNSGPARGINQVVVVDNRYVDSYGQVLYEGIALQGASAASYIGSPILTQQGTVIGMVTTLYNTLSELAFVVETGLLGPSQNYMAKVIEKLISGDDPCYVVCYGGISRYINPFPGFFISGAVPMVLPPVLPPVNAPFGYYHTFGPNDLIGPYFPPLLNTNYKAVEGFVLEGIASLSYFPPLLVPVDACGEPCEAVPCCPPRGLLVAEAVAPEGSVLPPFTNGDIILALGCCVLGAIPPQVAFWTAHAGTPAGSPIKVKYLLRSENFNCVREAWVRFPPIPLQSDLPSAVGGNP